MKLSIVIPVYNEKKTSIVQNFPSSQELISPESIPYQNRSNSIVYVGEASDIRGMRELIKLLELVDDTVRLLFIGRISTIGLEDELKTYPGWKKVEFLGIKTRKEVAYYLGQSRIGIVCFYPEPNHIEAQPNKLFEYMSVGIPVIASHFPKWKEIIDVHQTGITVNPLSVNDIADAVTYLLEHADKAEQMGKNGRNLVLSSYSWEAEEHHLANAYLAVLGETT